MSDITPLEQMTSPVESIQDGLRRLQQKDWKQELNSSGFSGDIKRGTLFMNSFVQGEVNVITELERRHMIRKGYVVPDTKLVFLQRTNPEDYYLARCSVDIDFKQGRQNVVQEILVNPAFIKELTRHNPRDWIKGKDEKGNIQQEGTAQDIFFLIGNEEAAHSVYSWNKIQEKSSMAHVSDQTMPTTAYDAVPVEFHALGWQIRGIMDRANLPEKIKKIMLKPLKRRMQEAIKYRQTLKPPKETARAARARLQTIAEAK